MGMFLQGDCGNGVGFTCGTSTAYTASAYGVPTTLSSPTNVCANIIAHASSGVSPTFALDGGTAIAINGALTINTQYKLCLSPATSTWNIAQQIPTGNCGNGVLKTCGTSTAYTLTTGQGLSGTPANGTCISFFPHTNSGASPTIAVDSVAATPLVNNYPLPTISAAALGAGTLTQACYTTATNQGAMSAVWAVLLFKAEDSCGSAFQCLIAYSMMDKHWADTYGWSYVGYEGGQQIFFSGSYGAAILGFALPFHYSPQVNMQYQYLLEMIKAVGMVEFMNYQNVGAWPSLNQAGGFWPFDPGLYAAGNPTPKHSSLTDYIRRTPCWWSGCRNN